jgi:hypothetical protein
VALEQARGRVRHLRTAEVGVNGEPAEAGDAAPRVGALEPHRARPLPVDLDEEEAECLGLALRALDLGQEIVAFSRAHRGKERLDLVVREEIAEEVDVVASCAPDGDAHAGVS